MRTVSFDVAILEVLGGRWVGFQKKCLNDVLHGSLGIDDATYLIMLKVIPLGLAVGCFLTSYILVSSKPLKTQ